MSGIITATLLFLRFSRKAVRLQIMLPLADLIIKSVLIFSPISKAIRQFLPPDAMLARYMLWLCVRLSVRREPVLHQNGKTGSRKTTPHDSPWTLSFLMPKILMKFECNHPSGAPNTGGVC